MKFDLTFEKTYPHPIEAVWRALTEPSALGEWLMETDFAPEEGRSFVMSCENPEGGTDRYLCELIAMEPLQRMVWSWTLDGHQADGETIVEFRLERVDGGTRLTLHHRGDRDPAIIDAFKGGWPSKLDRLSQSLDRLSRSAAG